MTLIIAMIAAVATVAADCKKDLDGKPALGKMQIQKNDPTQIQGYEKIDFRLRFLLMEAQAQGTPLESIPVAGFIELRVLADPAVLGQMLEGTANLITSQANSTIFTFRGTLRGVIQTLANLPEVIVIEAGSTLRPTSPTP